MYETIPALVRRHAEDAAFYWSQRSNTAFSPLLSFARFAHFDRLLDAHLDGLRVADQQSIKADGCGGNAGWHFVWANLKRWKGAGEAFVAYVLALEHAQSGNQARMSALWPLLEKHADTMLAGVVSACAWVEDEVARPWLEAWLAQRDFPLLQAVALRAYACRRETPQGVDLGALLASPHPNLRQAACKLAGVQGLSGLREKLFALRGDAALEVRAAALLALFQMGAFAGDETLLGDLWQTLKLCSDLHTHSRGLAKKRAALQSQTLARIVGHATPCGHAALAPALRTLPQRLAILVLAHQGNPSAVPALIALMGKKPYAADARLAAWALSFITGLDWSLPGLTLPAPALPEDEDERITPLQDPDVGLPWPNVPAVSAWWDSNAARFGAGMPMLLGGSATDPEHLFSVLRTGAQVSRWSAAMRLTQVDHAQPLFETRAPSIAQQVALGML